MQRGNETLESDHHLQSTCHVTDTSSVVGILTQPSEWALVAVIFEGLTTADAPVSAPPTTHRVCSPLSCTPVSIHLRQPAPVSLLENFPQASGIHSACTWRLGSSWEVCFIVRSNSKWAHLTRSQCSEMPNSDQVSATFPFAF